MREKVEAEQVARFNEIFTPGARDEMVVKMQDQLFNSFALHSYRDILKSHLYWVAKITARMDNMLTYVSHGKVSQLKEEFEKETEYLELFIVQLYEIFPHNTLQHFLDCAGQYEQELLTLHEGTIQSTKINDIPDCGPADSKRKGGGDEDMANANAYRSGVKGAQNSQAGMEEVFSDDDSLKQRDSH